MRFIYFGLVFVNLLQVILALNCTNVKYRPNVHKMPAADRNRYFNAIKWLNNGTKPTRWDTFARKHVQLYEEVHMTSKFIAWHRRYLAELEEMLTEYHKDVRIPYWDWTVHYENILDDPIWAWFGKTGNKSKDNCVTTGEFKDFTVYYGGDLKEKPSKRCFKRNDKFEKRFSEEKSSVDQFTIDEKNATEFGSNIEISGHGMVHNGIGFDFSGAISNNDPIFFSHHAFIDMIWFVRQKRHADWGYSYPDSADAKIPGYKEKIKDVLDIKKLCYDYKEDNFSFKKYPQAIGTRMAISSIPVPEPFVPLKNSQFGVMSDDNVNIHAKNYVLNGVVGPILGLDKTFNNKTCNLIGFTNPLPIEFIKNMHYDEVKTRENERKKALYISEQNEECLRKSINLK